VFEARKYNTRRMIICIDAKQRKEAEHAKRSEASERGNDEDVATAMAAPPSLRIFSILVAVVVGRHVRLSVVVVGFFTGSTVANT